MTQTFTRSRRILPTVFAAAITSIALNTQASELIQRPNAIPGRYIVVLQDETPADVQGLSERSRSQRRLNTAIEMSGRGGGRSERVYERAIHGFSASLSDQGVRTLLKDPRVRYIEQDAVISLNQTIQSPATWGLDRIDQKSRPLTNSYAYQNNGSGVHAYIIDTGLLATHTEFQNSGTGTFRVGNGSSAIVDGLGNADCNGHGTHVAGTVGGNTYGVAKGVTLHPVRVLDCAGSGTIAGVIAGVDWVTANHVKPAVANMSLGGGASAALDTAVRNSIAAGVTYALAAGNGNALGIAQDACLGSPSRVTEALVVGATDSTDTKASWSNFGTCLAIFAPGVNITSSWYTGTTATNTISGTSMASPHVAGAVALYLEKNPTATPAQVRAAMVAQATAGVVTTPGTGSPNYLLFSLSNFAPPSNDTPPVASFTSACAGPVCTLTSTSTDAVGSIIASAWDFGDGTTGSGTPMVKTYSANGTYTVRLTVTDSANQSSSATANLTVSGVGPPCTACTSQTGRISAVGASTTLGSFTRTAGTLRGWMQGPAATNFNLYLQRRSTLGIWSDVAASTSAGSTEAITYTATSGTYRWRVVSVTGTGSFTVWTQ